jgi:tellurite resistance protein TerC
VLIVAGTSLLNRFAWIQYVFGMLLAVAAIRLLFEKPGVAPAHGPVKWIRDCCLPRDGGSRLALSSLLFIILAVEATDLIFALDSIPAVLAVTRDTWIAFTSNIFAVLGLRSLYFALASVLDRFHMLHYGLACGALGRGAGGMVAGDHRFDPCCLRGGKPDRAGTSGSSWPLGLTVSVFIMGAL